MNTIETKTSLAAYERTKSEVAAKLQAAKAAYEKQIIALNREYESASQGARIILDGIDPEAVLLAEHVIYIRGTYTKAGQDAYSQREGAIQDILKGGPALKREYFGTKNYDRWHGQGSNHAYGYGPTHGSIIFEIGLQPEARSRDLTGEEINAAVYYLRNLDRIQEARSSSH